MFFVYSLLHVFILFLKGNQSVRSNMLCIACAIILLSGSTVGPRPSRPSCTKGLVTNYGEGGGATKQEGGHVKFYTYDKGGGPEKVLAMLKGGGGGGVAQQVLG